MIQYALLFHSITTSGSEGRISTNNINPKNRSHIKNFLRLCSECKYY